MRLLHGLWSKAPSTSSREAPRVSGWNARQTRVVISEHVPNMKYGPEDDFAKNKGVVKAIIQLIALYSLERSVAQRTHHTHPVGALPETTNGRASTGRLYFCSNDTDTDGPSTVKPDHEDVDKDYDSPSSPLVISST